jgi:hypothetical protein
LSNQCKRFTPRIPLFSDAAAAQLVDHDHRRHVLQTFQQLFEEPIPAFASRQGDGLMSTMRTEMAT